VLRRRLARSIMRKDRIKLSSWIAVGFGLNQFLHTLAYSAGKGVTGFPNTVILIKVAYLLALILFLLTGLLFVIFFKALSKKPALTFGIFILLEICSQICSSSILKGGFEMLMAVVIYTVLIVERYYDEETIQSLEKEALRLIHGELTTLFRVSVSSLIFVIGVLGISFAVQFLQKYYNTPFFHSLMVWYGIMTVYTATGILFFVNYRLFSRMICVREILIFQQK
jgi:hypothetical protein